MQLSRIPALLLVLLPWAACQCGPAPGLDSGFDAARRDAGWWPDTSWPDVPPLDRPATDTGPQTDAALLDAAPPDATGPDGFAPDAAVEDIPPSDGPIVDTPGVDQGVPLAPPAPTEVAAFSGAAIRLTFAAAPRATSYRAYVAFNAGGPYALAAAETTATAIEVRGLAIGPVHFFVVRAVNGSGESPDSVEVSAQALDGVSFLRGTLSGVVRRDSLPVVGARVRLYREIDHGTLLAEASSDGSGAFQLIAPTGLYRGLIAGDDLDLDGNAFETGVDAVGVFLPMASGLGGAALEVRADADSGGIAIDLAVAAPDRTISGSVSVGDGWPSGHLVVEAFDPQSRLRPYRQVLSQPGAFALDVPAGSYQVQAFLDVDNNGEQEVNEPRDRVAQQVDVTAGDATGQDLAIAAATLISGVLTGGEGWRVSAEDERSQLAAVYSVAAPAGLTYQVPVPAESSYTVRAFDDRDGNGVRSWYDADGDGQRSSDEEWAEPGLPARAAIAAGSGDVDFVVDRTVEISGQVTPAGSWRVVARTAAGDDVAVGASDSSGAFTLTAAAGRTYYVYAFADSDGDERRTLGREPLLLYGAPVDTSAGNVAGCHIVGREVRGSISGDRGDPGSGIVETVVVQQVVAGVGGGLFCAASEFNNYARPGSGGSFALTVGAIGSGGGSLAWTDCAPDCTGVTVSRYLDYGADYVHAHEGCGIPQPYTYPASPASPTAPALVLDTSAGDVSDVNF